MHIWATAMKHRKITPKSSFSKIIRLFKMSTNKQHDQKLKHWTDVDKRKSVEQWPKRYMPSPSRRELVAAHVHSVHVAHYSTKYEAGTTVRPYTRSSVGLFTQDTARLTGLQHACQHSHSFIWQYSHLIPIAVQFSSLSRFTAYKSSRGRPRATKCGKSAGSRVGPRHRWDIGVIQL